MQNSSYSRVLHFNQPQFGSTFTPLKEKNLVYLRKLLKKHIRHQSPQKLQNQPLKQKSAILNSEAISKSLSYQEKHNIGIHIRIGSESTLIRGLTTNPNIPALEINNTIRLNKLRYVIPNFNLFMFRNQNEEITFGLLDQSNFEFYCDPNHPNWVALQELNDPTIIITSQMIFRSIFQKYKKWLSHHHHKKIGKAYFELPFDFPLPQKKMLSNV
jgi:hypothetical protein